MVWTTTHFNPYRSWRVIRASLSPVVCSPKSESNFLSPGSVRVPYDTLASFVVGISASRGLEFRYRIVLPNDYAQRHLTHLSCIFRFSCLKMEFQAALDVLLSTFSPVARYFLHPLSMCELIELIKTCWEHRGQMTSDAMISKSEKVFFQ